MNQGSPKVEEKLGRLKEVLHSADAVVVGAGAGLSSAAGFTYAGKRFEENFSDLVSIWSQQTASPAQTVILRNRRKVVSKWSQLMP